ncbi:MAG: peptidoglycan-associated lipoprotein Pal [Pseudomonadota bacterium]
MNFKLLGTSGLIATMALLAACTTTEEPPVVEEVEPTMSAMEMAAQMLATEVGDIVFFGYDEYNLTPEAQATLSRQADWLNMVENTGIRVLVAGNCDERGTREYNLALGARRADAAKAYLVGLGVDPSRINTISYGKERPMNPGSTPEAWAQNRNSMTSIVAIDMMDDMMMDDMSAY